MSSATDKALALLRIALGWIFFWPFLDKTFGLGFSTAHDSAWIRGGHPTRGFLGNAEGWMSGLFNALSDSVVVEWLFMLGLLGIGLSLLLGIGLRIGTISGAVLLGFMYLAVLPFSRTTETVRGDTNPFVDDHIVYGIALITLFFANAGRTWGLGAWWQGLPFVQKYRWLQ